MAFRSGLFTSTEVTVNGDGIPVGNKAITTEQRALELYHIYGNGISLKPTSAFYVAPKSGLIATVSAGWGIMNGYTFEETTDYDITMTSSTSDQTLYIGVRLDTATGEYTNNHVAARTTFVEATDRVFAIIVIPANAVTLTAGMITHTRNSSTYCGTVDANREALAALQAEYAEKLETLEETGIPDHATTHAADGDDPITPASIGAATFDTIYPVGAIYMSVVSTPPASLFGGTWAAWGTGRVPVGVDAGQTEFNTVEKTGGAKTHTLAATEMPAHTHGVPAKYNSATGTSDPNRLMDAVAPGTNAPDVTTTSAGNGLAHNNLQPYITCYMWKRTA